MTRQQYEVFCTHLFHLATDIGIRPASRALGISESKGLKIAWRRKWNISRYCAPTLKQTHSNGVSTNGISALESDRIAEDVKERLLAQRSGRTKLALASAAATASEHLATLEGSKLCTPHSGIAADTWSRTADRVHGWQAERSKPLVQIANVTLPTPEEREARRRAHAALDEIAKALRLRE